MVLELGAKGDAVRRLQLLLNGKLHPGPKLRVDGHFGGKTELAVQKFQFQQSLEADGVVGAQTWAALGQRETQETAPAVIDAMGAPWFTIANAEKGVIANSRPGEHNTRILEYHKTTTLKATTDEVPWCAAFVNWCLDQAHKTGCGSARAIDWLDWGQELKQPRTGAITIIHDKRKDTGYNAATGSTSGNHVSFFVSQSKSHITLFGGNQHRQVKQSLYPLENYAVLGYRWPIG
jgi:uncharacterized protein (TIGR02594 family)